MKTFVILIAISLWSRASFSQDTTCLPSYCNLQTIYEKVFEAKTPDGTSCVGCHASSSSPGKLDFSSPEKALKSLKNQKVQSTLATTPTEISLGTPQIHLVSGKPEQSYLVSVLRRPKAKGGMPQGNYNVHEYWIRVIEQWILLGLPTQ